MAGVLIPTVVDGAEHYGRAYDIYSLLLKNRAIFLGTAVTQESANLIVAELLYLSHESPDQPIHLYIHSPGGDAYAGFAIYDAMQMISAPVYTYAVGMTASMGTILLASGAKGHRYALPHATIHMHPASSGAQGYTNDVRIAFREQERVQIQMFHLMSKHTGRDWQEIERHYERDRWVHAVEAKEFGLIDHVIGNVNDLVIGTSGDQLLLAGNAPKQISSVN
jgi:ATP-dependent Clp protease, protease subunit